MGRLLTLFGSGSSGASSPVIIAGNRNRVPNLVAVSASSNVMKYDGVYHKAPKDTALTQVRAFFENRFAQANGPNSVTGLLSFKLQASLEYPIGGTLYPLLFSGLDEVTLAPGDGLWTDWSSPVAIPAGADYRIRCDREHLSTGGGNYNQLSGCLISSSSTPGKTDHATSGTDNTVHKSRGGTYAAFSGTSSAYTASLVQGKAARRVKTVKVLTDSIGRGVGDTKATATVQQGDWLNGISPTTDYPNWGNIGWVETSLGINYPYFSMAVAGKQVVGSSLNLTNLAAQFDLMSASPPGYGILGLGVNDLMLGRTPAQVLADLIAAVAMITARFPGIKVFVCTITPVTNTTDAYATTANQTFTGTPPAGGTVTWSNFNGTDDTTGRRKLNADIRAGLVTGAAGSIDVALACQDATDPRLWRTDLGAPTTDGVHPQAVLHRAMAAVPDYATLFA
jgi:hypothetical protein